MQSRWWRIMVFSVAVVAMLLLANTYAEAQCSMCRAALTSATNSRFIRNFNIGILVLLVPPVSIFCSIFFVMRRFKGHE